MSKNSVLENLNPSELDLGGLTEIKFSGSAIRAVMERQSREQAAFKEKYGERWFEKWVEYTTTSCDYDSNMKYYNTVIYRNGVLCVAGQGVHYRKTLVDFEARCRELYGDMYDELRVHRDKDSRVVELLLQDAIKTGKWKELPDELQNEYHRRAGDM